MLAGVPSNLLARRMCAIVSLKIVSELAEDAHRQVPEFPADFHRHIENQQAVDAGLVLANDARWSGRVPLKVDVKRVAVAGVVIERRRQLDSKRCWGK